MASEREKNRLIPSFVQLVVETMIRTKAVQTEGIFRVSGSTASVEKFKDKANQGFDYPDLLTSLDSHSMASVLKLFYRELPEPLLTSELMDQFMTAGKIADEDERIKLLSSTIQQLPLYNKALLQYTMKFFVLTAAYREVNKMHSNNIAICLAPLLLPNSSNDPFDTSGQHAGLLVVQTLIDHYNLIFAVRPLLFLSRKKKKKKRRSDLSSVILKMLSTGNGSGQENRRWKWKRKWKFVVARSVVSSISRIEWIFFIVFLLVFICTSRNASTSFRL